MKTQDIFDIISPDETEEIKVDALIDDGSSDDLKKKLVDIQKEIIDREKKKKESNDKLISSLKNFIKSEISKIEIKQNVVERVVEKQPIIKNIHVPFPVSVPATPPPQIIKETRVEVPVQKVIEVSKKEIYADQKLVDELKKEIETLKKDLEETRRMAESPIVTPSGSGVIGIPPPEPNPDGHVLTVSKGKAIWQASSGGSGSDPIYIGDSATEGNWRFTVSGTSLSIQRLESGIWVEKSAVTA